MSSPEPSRVEVLAFTGAIIVAAAILATGDLLAQRGRRGVKRLRRTMGAHIERTNALLDEITSRVARLESAEAFRRRDG